MAQDYTISIFKVGDYKDNYGNVWCEVAFEGVSEPARWSMKPESTEKYSVGTKVYGHIEDATSQAGKPYNRFKTDQRPDDSEGSKTDFKPAVNSWNDPKKEDAIARAVALRHAAVMYQGVGTEDASQIVLRIADKFYDWLIQTSIEDDIKGFLND